MSGNWSDWELIDNGSFNGLKKWMRSSGEDEGTVQVRYEQDCSAIIDDNKRAQAEFSRTESLGEGYLAAKIPAIVLLEWKTKYGVDPWDPNHAEARRRLLNSPDYRYLKRTPLVI